MPTEAGERVRLTRATAAPQGWHPTNFLADPAATDEWDWCFAFERRQQGHVQLSDLEGTDEFVSDEPSETTLFAGQDLAEVVDYAGAVRLGSSESGADAQEQNQWDAMLDCCCAKVSLGCKTTQRGHADSNVHVRLRRAERSTQEPGRSRVRLTGFFVGPKS